MKKQFIKIIYNQWEDSNVKQTTGIEEEIKQCETELKGLMNALKGRTMDNDGLLELESTTNALQACAHRQGFYTGFEAACNILREIMGVKD